MQFEIVREKNFFRISSYSLGISRLIAHKRNRNNYGRKQEWRKDDELKLRKEMNGVV